jgi:hypothetical protein
MTTKEGLSVNTIIKEHWNEGQSKNLCVQDTLAAARERRSAYRATIRDLIDHSMTSLIAAGNST